MLLASFALIVIFISFFRSNKQERSLIINKPITLSPTPTNVPLSGYIGYNKNGKRFGLVLPGTCNEHDGGINKNKFNRFLITCLFDNSKILINPQEGGRGFESQDIIDKKSGKINLDNHEWIYSTTIFSDRNAISAYEFTDPPSNDYYLIGVSYYPYSEKARAYFEQILSTFKFIDSPENSAKEDVSTPGETGYKLWDPICDDVDAPKFDIKVGAGDGITIIARKAVQSYFNAVNLSNIPDKSSYLTSEENIYAEDFVRKSLNITSLYTGQIISIPCKIVEEGSVKARLLTISQKENLEKYSESVESLQINEWLQELVNESSKDLKIKPIIIGF